jgi:sugar phosphate isomerase/epimerase
MAIQLACSTEAFGDLPFEQAAERAHALGYQGLDVRVAAANDAKSDGPVIADVGLWKDVLARCQLEAVSLSTSVALGGRSSRRNRALDVDHVEQVISLAAQIGCRNVCIRAADPGAGQTPRSMLQRIVEDVQELAQRAADSNVMLLFENSAALSRAEHWWHLLSDVDHPRVGMAWHVGASDDVPQKCVPVLSKYLHLVKLCDHLADGKVVPLGEGVVPLKIFVERLLGIGYDGYMIIDWYKAGTSAARFDQAQAESYLSSGAELLGTWFSQIADAIDKAQVKAAKAAKKNAPKPRAELKLK